MSFTTPHSILDALFPPPTRSSDNALTPVLSPGHSPASADALLELLKSNHEQFHVFFNEKGFHNHIAHHLYANYALGAPPEALKAVYKAEEEYQRLAFDSPGAITDSNWIEHLGDERYYRAYLKLFSKAVLDTGIDATLDKYVFSLSANWVDNIQDVKKQPQMVNRLLSGVVHPLIHAGHGLEFGSPGMIAEGISMACATHKTDFDELIPKTLFLNKEATALSSLVSALSLSGTKSKGLHSFAIIARMLNDPELAPGTAHTTEAHKGPAEGDGGEGGGFPLVEIIKNKGELIRKYAEEWSIDTSDKAGIHAKLEELFVLVTLLYGVVGLQEGKEFKADFFLMHLVTSSIFLPSYLTRIKPASQAVLLSSYLACALSVWVARGRPAPKIASFYARTSPTFVPPGPMPTSGEDTLAPESAQAPNPWMPVLQSAVVHPNEHLPKALRALAHFAHLLAGRPAGTWSGTGLAGAEVLDGTLFVRVAGLTMNRLGWVREGDKKGEWDFTGFWE
ncbi:hypothetical protein M0805_001179 [Coniferiporia weirii]|nr:hypothetical protein M0805_001179 [Coniferiporia weirii]